MDFREFVENMLIHAFTMGVNFNAAGPMYKIAIKRELIGQYAEVYCLDGKEIKFFGKLNKTLTTKNAFDVVLMSVGCVKDITSGKKPYYEHIEPISFAFKNLCMLRPKCTSVDVQNIMRYCKIVGLTPDEKNYLDHIPYNYFNKADVEKIKVWVSEIDKGGLKNSKQAIDSMKDTKGNWLNTKDHGTAYARLAHLVNCGVKFVWGADPNPDPGKKQEEIIKDYLENKFYKYDQIKGKWIVHIEGD